LINRNKYKFFVVSLISKIKDNSSENPKDAKFVFAKVLVRFKEIVFSIKVLKEENIGSIKVIDFIFMISE
jgi:hypothetical protein